MKAFEKPAQDKTTQVPDAGNMELGKRIFELVMSESLAPRAALGTLKIITMQTPLGQKWLKFWRAAILLQANLHHRIPSSPDLHPKRAREARRLLKSLLPVGGLDTQEKDEQELVFHSMILLGQLETWASEEHDRLRAIQLLAQVTALTAYYDSPLNEEAEKAYKKACDELAKWHSEGLAHKHMYDEYEQERKEDKQRSDDAA